MQWDLRQGLVPPEDLRELDRRLRAIRFRPRRSLGPELEGAVRGGQPFGSRRRTVERVAQLVGLAGILWLAIYLLWTTLLGEAGGR